MTSPSSRPRRWRIVAVVLLSGALFTAPWTANATTVKDSGTSDVTVFVPPAGPATPPSSQPDTTPPNGWGGGSGSSSGGSSTGGSGSANGRSGGTGTAAPAGDPAPGSAAAAACVPKEPAVPTTPATTGGDAAVDKSVYLSGETVTATASGFGANEQVQLVFFTEPALVGSFAADAAGAVTAQFAVSEETLAGTHVAQFTGWCGTIATADVLVGAINSASDAGQQGVPVWAWWVGGVLGAILLAIGAWWAIRTMRAPGAEAVPA